MIVMIECSSRNKIVVEMILFMIDTGFKDSNSITLFIFWLKCFLFEQIMISNIF